MASPQTWDSLTWIYICIVAFTVGGLIVASERWHGSFTGDSDLTKPQASHSRATPRVGGLAVVAGSLAGLLVLGPSNMTLTWLWPVLFIAVMPVFVAGLLEDITKDVGSGKRLVAAFHFRRHLRGGCWVGCRAWALRASTGPCRSGRCRWCLPLWRWAGVRTRSISSTA